MLTDNTLVNISNPFNSKSLTAKVKNTIKYPSLYNIVITKKMADDLKSKRWCGISDRKYTDYDVNKIGWNFYMNEFSAAIGLAQLEKIQKMNNKRKNIAKIYDKELNASEKIPFTSTCVYHLYWICVRDRKIFRKKLLEKGIETGTHYRPIHNMTLFNKKNNLPNTELVGKEIVTIPTHPNLSEDDVNYIIKKINFINSKNI